MAYSSIGKIIQFLTGSWSEASFPNHVGLSTGLLECFPNMASGFLRVSDSREKEQDRSPDAFYDLALGVIYHHFCLILLIIMLEGTIQEHKY